MQLLFAEGLVGLSGVVGRPRSTRHDRAVAALSPVLTMSLGGVRLVWGGSDYAQWSALCDSAQPAA
eukprot:364372-Chlamydomonas_euryale.AAC.7